jgi:hypothetical protein
MNIKSMLVLCFAAIAMTGIVSNASAQGKTRAEVRQELIQAEANGADLVTDTSYPDVAPIFQAQVQGAPRSHDDVGGSTTATATGNAAGAARCVGPNDFCTPYFGS